MHLLMSTMIGAAFLTMLATAVNAADSQIRLNTVGYLPEAQKKASIAAACEEFSVVRVSDGAAVFSGKIEHSINNDDTGEKLFIADFSDVQEPGVYRLEVKDVGRSPEFRVATDVYNEPF